MNEKWGAMKLNRLPKDIINTSKCFKNIIADEPIVYLSNNKTTKKQVYSKNKTYYF